MSQRHSLRNPSTKGTKTKENSFETVEIQEEIAASIAYLASDEARFVTGIGFAIDGGQTVG